MLLRDLDAAIKQRTANKDRPGFHSTILKTDGVLVLAAANVDRYEELARARVADTTTRALPALAAGRLYVRDTRTLKCLDVGVEAL